MKELFLAPMHKIGILSFRELCRKCEADTAYTPMISTKAYLYNPDNFKWTKKEAVQLIGNEPEEFKECAKKIRDCEYLDLNAGCPSNDAVSIGAGAALLKNPDKLSAIIKAMAKYSNVPVSVKIRLGWKKDESLKIAKLAEKSGAERIAVHARKFIDNYSVKADWNAIKKIKKELKMPVIANGDIDSAISAKECLKITGADGLMIARKAMTNPLIFKEIKHYEKAGEILRFEKKDKAKLINDFIKLYKKHEKYNFSELRTQAVLMCNGFKDSAKMRNGLSKCLNEKELTNLFNS
ncbi:MAG: tRNA-dihydrouridine synthase family protein [Candidatus Nanoarchaeia archaeon]|nr:tRNA-dihydrouridine synthase family protein [Candidatus Nanoarchaeia archaeon]